MVDHPLISGVDPVALRDLKKKRGPANGWNKPSVFKVVRKLVRRLSRNLKHFFLFQLCAIRHTHLRLIPPPPP